MGNERYYEICYKKTKKYLNEYNKRNKKEGSNNGKYDVLIPVEKVLNKMDVFEAGITKNWKKSDIFKR